MRVFVVDDDAAVRESLGRALRLEGYDVELAADGAEALERLESDGADVDLVVLDVLMPAVDGLEVCRRLRRNGSRLPVLMLTARDEVADRVAGLDAGADDYVVKPFALAELLARVRALLRRSADEAVDVLHFADLVPSDGRTVVRLVMAGILGTEAFLLISNWHRANDRISQRLLTRMWGSRGPANRRERGFARILRDGLALLGIGFAAAAVFQLLVALHLGPA